MAHIHPQGWRELAEAFVDSGAAVIGTPDDRLVRAADVQRTRGQAETEVKEAP